MYEFDILFIYVLVYEILKANWIEANKKQHDMEHAGIEIQLI